MNNAVLKKHIESMGARVKFRHLDSRARWDFSAPDTFSIDILSDKRGEYFEIAQGKEAPDFELLQVLPKERHLLLYCRDGQRFLLGFDERHWFTAGIEGAVSTVRDAKQSLLPEPIREQVMHLPARKVDNRRNAVFIRQGEWFFIPINRSFPDSRIHRNEPIQRTAWSKPHICQELCRDGGELVYIVGGIERTAENFEALKKRNPALVRRSARMMVRNPDVYVRGYIKHEDHATVKLGGWHQVFINNEHATSSIRFLD